MKARTLCEEGVVHGRWQEGNDMAGMLHLQEYPLEQRFEWIEEGMVMSLLKVRDGGYIVEM